MPAEDVASIYRWERGTGNPGDQYRLYYCRTLGTPPGPDTGT